LHTLQQLKSGELTGITRLKIIENLSTFPTEIYQLADSLEILDLSSNQLCSLPNDFAKLHKLKILFLSDNAFTHLPEVLGLCPELEMIGFKANQIKTVSEKSLPPKTRWLILTDNQIKTLPNAIGQLKRLQKLMLAGNQLTTLPESMAQCKNLQLLRISANQLSELPDWLLALPKLAWLAFSGNPFCKPNDQQAFTQPKNIKRLPTVALNEFKLNKVLGEGASGLIYHANWLGSSPTKASTKQIGQNKTQQDVAIKLFKGQVTSDGYPEDELKACVIAGQHQNLVQMVAQIQEPNQAGLVMTLIPETYFNLGLPPCFKTCTRDNFSEGFTLSDADISKIIEGATNALKHLHNQQLCHGDFYAHNILIDHNANVLLSDLGAASYFQFLPEQQQRAIKKIEMRALNHLIEDLSNLK